MLIRSKVGESPIWLKAQSEAMGLLKKQSVPLRAIFAVGNRKKVIAASLIAFLGMYGLLGRDDMDSIVSGCCRFNAKQVPLWTFFILLGSVVGYLVHGTIGDRFGRKKCVRLVFCRLDCLHIHLWLAASLSEHGSRNGSGQDIRF